MWKKELDTVVCTDSIRDILDKFKYMGRLDISALVGGTIKTREPAVVIKCYRILYPVVVCEVKVSLGNWKEQQEFYFELAGEKWLRGKCERIKHGNGVGEDKDKHEVDKEHESSVA